MKDNKKTIRKRNILYLIENFLIENGCKETAQFLRNEAKLNKDYGVCDNINLEAIVIEYETYYYHRFQTYPLLCKKNSSENSPKKTTKILFKEHWSNKTISNSITELDLVIQNTLPINMHELEKNIFENEFVNIIQNACVEKSKINLIEVKGLDNIKEILKEAIVYPIKYPQLFSGIIQPWKGILLYGPPGTGKTSLAKAIAGTSDAKFFNVSASTIVNKWRGETEKLIKALFQMACECSPSIIFFDEIDALTLKRNMCEHEASRRMKSELFSSMDTLANLKENVFFLATTNTPWDLDEAMLRRFEKHIFVPLPDKETRKLLFQHFLPNIICDDPSIACDVNYENAADITENFSSCDIKHMCKELLMNSMRQIFISLESRGTSKNKISRKIITNQDFEIVVKNFQPSVHHLQENYLKWQSGRKKN